MQKVRRFVLYFGIILIIIQKSPPVVETKYGLFRTIIYILFALLLMLAIHKKAILRMNYIFNICILFCFLQFLLFLMMELFGFLINWFELVEIIITMSILLIGASIKLSEKELIKLSLFFIIMTLLVSVWQIYYYQGDFSIHRNYTIPLKNSIGPILIISISILAYYILFLPLGKNLRFIKYILLVILFVGFYLSIVIRSRGAILAFLIYLSILLAKKYSYKYLFPMLAIIIFSVMPGLKINKYFWNPIINSFTLNYDPTDMESISAGRYSVIIDSLYTIKEEPLFGISKIRSRPYLIPHNYLINKILNYGIIGGLFFILIYVLITVFVLKEVLFKSPCIKNIGIYLFLIPLVISIFEYSYPFGPGTSNFMVYFMLADSIKLGNNRRV